MRRLHPAAIAAIVAALLLPSCATRREITGLEVDGLDRKLSTFAFIEDGKLVEFIVGTKSARYREEDAYVPFEIVIANRGLRTLSLSRESFVLADEQGRRYQAANPRELLESYEFLDWDRTLAELRGIVDTRFAAFTQYPSNFSPRREVQLGRSNVVRDVVSLPKFGYLVDYIYFPQPEDGIKNGEYELFLYAPELPDPVFVRFRVE